MSLNVSESRLINVKQLGAIQANLKSGAKIIAKTTKTMAGTENTADPASARGVAQRFPRGSNLS